MLDIIPSETPNLKMYQYLLACIAPRPIAFASTISRDGQPNLSPFSYFNFFGVNPTTLIFSPTKRGRDATSKDTHENLKEVPEVVINVVTYDMVNQASLASSMYPKGVNEFIKAGFTMEPSELIRPFRVKESPVQLECKVRDIIETGPGGLSANLIICEVLLMHINESILAEDGQIDLHKIRLVGRMGKEYYVKAFGDAIIKVDKPTGQGIGIDQLPEKIRNSSILTGNDLGRLGNLESFPTNMEIETLRELPEIKRFLSNSKQPGVALQHYARTLLEEGKVKEALAVLMLVP
jgi:flavin reductase (DIM6/NTAB) family NADH-FMN oxidoreductase RutF